MFAIIGIVVVFGCIAAGYLMEHGSLRVLLQPAEMLIIGGAAVGTVQAAMKQMTDFEKLKSHIDMPVTAEGLRIELSESASGTFFSSGSAKLNSDGAELLITLAQELSGLPNKLSIEGHTDSEPYAPSATYGNWELSADRANAARRVMQSNGIRSDQITPVRGFADQRLRKPNAPLDPANRRISVIVQYIVKNTDDEAEPEKNPESHSE
jgi:chemotaxis protein MotB